ncbi:MAG: hypothetical protein A3E78_14845 [Alphaproteobacteria bacterium RIFCSPHIGHO2_12_FULL_63_12]|nr:MAG: hypothetical protein A3E78_14845 [Alphaproteobacteria bacterium RIFCSPHIGHO2_12_FULL_63_12]
MSGAAVKTPWHLWAVGVLGALWNSFGCFDYFMTMTKGDEWMTSAGMTPEQIAFMHEAPAWMNAVWAIGVWGALLGSILLLLRNKLAVPVFGASLVAYVISVIHTNFLRPMPGASSSMMIMQAVIFAGCVFFLWYAMRARKSGLLT